MSSHIAGSLSTPDSSHRKQPSSNSVIWAHLLRKDNVSSSTPRAEVPLPPLGPIDKNATSTRILLHDTQANLQQFSERVDKMTQGLNTTKQEILAVKKLYQEEHERLLVEMVDLVNRCQAEIQKPLGQPAQSDKMENLQKTFELRFENLDRRLDVVQTLQSSHSQALQTQNQLLQSLKDQQTTIVAAVSPLLPLLQALPLQIESIRNTVNEVTSKALDSARSTPLPVPRTIPATPRTSTSPHQVNLPTSQPGSTVRKRRRLDENAQEVRPTHKTPTVTKATVMASLVRGSSFSRRESTTPRQPLATLVPSTPKTNVGSNAQAVESPAVFSASRIRTSVPSTTELSGSVFRVPAVPNASSTPQTSTNAAGKRSSLLAQLEAVSEPSHEDLVAGSSRLGTPVPKRLNPLAESLRTPVALSSSVLSTKQTPTASRQEVLNPPSSTCTTGPKPHPLLARNPTLRVPTTGPRPVPLRQRRSPFVSHLFRGLLLELY
ncbi:hypothetical protein V5O48_012246 [Marasmius crinis-equi]|uniref:Uncharacterized protein n=1 Tax=Marasmius crinis-equi TaxID=585013 RepID=A0ABR3F3L8_9AGAR